MADLFGGDLAAPMSYAQTVIEDDPAYATLATRNTSNFTGTGVNLINPWESAGSAPKGGQQPG